MTPFSPVWALLFARCAGFVSRAPGFSHPSVPVVARAGIAFVLSLGLFASIAPQHDVEAPFIAALVFEVLLGAAIGFGASLLYEGAAAGGRMLDDYVGIQVSNPSAQAGEGQAFAQLWGLGFVAAFFILDGYRLVLLALAESVRTLPPGGSLAMHGLREYAWAVPMLVAKAAVLVAGPALALGLIANVALGSVSRIIPRFTNFTLTFPVVFLMILLTSLVTLPFIVREAGRPWMYLPMVQH